MAERVVTTQTTTEPAATEVREVRPAASTVAARIIWFIAGVILILLAFRFVLALLGANPNNGFAHFIYSTSHPFVAPFFGLFNYDEVTTGVGHFELFTLVAMAVYAIIAWLLTYLLTLGRPRTPVA